MYPPAGISRFSTVYNFPLSEMLLSAILTTIPCSSIVAAASSIVWLLYGIAYIVGMAFEITVHALLLKVISEYPVSFTIERLSNRNRVQVSRAAFSLLYFKEQ
jgi:hypothetical protein